MDGEQTDRAHAQDRTEAADDEDAPAAGPGASSGPDGAGPAPLVLPPVVPGRWFETGAEHREAIIVRFAHYGLDDLAARTARLRVLPLDFYPGWMLCEVLLSEDNLFTEVEAVCVLYGPDGVTPLEHGAVIPRHNKRHGVVLETEAQCLDYARFAALFQGFDDVAHEILPLEGRRVSCADASGARPALTEAPHVAISPAGEASPLDLVRAPQRARIAATVLHGASLSRMTFRLSQAGDLTVLDAQLMCADAALRPTIRRDGARRVWVAADGSDAR